jgi:glycosyltransferase involved in cell wall biosynthesis
MISVVMATWNRKEFIPKSIESVLCQTYKDFEFIIVDDGSTDGAIEVIEEYAKRDKRIIFIKKIHTGCTDTFNKGLQAVKGDAICIIGSDDLWLPTKLEVQVEYAKQYPGHILHNNSISINEREEILNFSIFPENDKGAALFGPTHSWFVTSSWYIPKEVQDKVGYWETVYNDYQWMMRAVLLWDIPVKLIPDLLTCHRSNPQSNTFKDIGQNKFIELGKEVRDEMKVILSQRGKQ